MIKQIEKSDIDECVEVIQKSFQTVADEFGITRENAPRYVAFATTRERLLYHFEQEKRPMFAYYNENRIVGYYSLYRQNENECELNNLCVLEEYRHNGIGDELLQHAFNLAKGMGCTIMNIGIVEENKDLRKWYEMHGAEHTGIKKFDFFPFTCGYMIRRL